MIAYVFQKYSENFTSLLFNSFQLSFQFINKTLRPNNLKNRTVMNVKISVFVVCVEAIMYLLYNLHDCTFNGAKEDRVKTSIKRTRV